MPLNKKLPPLPEEVLHSGKKKKLAIAGAALCILAAGNTLLGSFRPPKYGEEAAQRAQELIETSYISKARLLDELTSDYSEEAAEYALEQVAETDWKQEAAEALDDFISKKDISRQKLQNLLQEQKFEPAEMDHAFSVRAGDLDFDAFALTALNHHAHDRVLNRPGARTFLEGELFEKDQIQKAIDSDAVDWKKAAQEEARKILSSPISEAVLKEKLQESEYLDDEIQDCLAVLKPDFGKHCLDFMTQDDKDEMASESGLRKRASEQKFTEEQIEQAIQSRSCDWKYNAVRYPRHLCSSSALKKDDLSSRLADAGFTSDQSDFVLKYYDESKGIDDVKTIQNRIKEEEEKQKAEEEARQKAEEEARQKEEARRQEEAQRQAEEEARRQQEAAQQQTPAASGIQVYLPRTGQKYHYNRNCSNMKNPTPVPLEDAQAMGIPPCSKCAR